MTYYLHQMHVFKAHPRAAFQLELLESLLLKQGTTL
jgi:hypothetical protein